MSISSAELTLQVASAASPAPSRPAAPASPSPVRAAASAAESTADSPHSAPAVPSSSQLSTDLRIDRQHQLYYEFVDDSTGSVVFEIPPEALRAIGESLNLPLNGDATAHGVDVKS